MSIVAPTTATEIDQIHGSIKRAIDTGTQWVLDRLGPDGHPGAEHCHYYRVPWTLAITGHRAEASAVMSWVEREALAPNGDMKAGGPRTGFETHWASYPVAIFATGAWHIERYDTANLLADRLAAYQDPETGGAFAAHPDHRVDRRQDIFPTAQLGMTGITTGHMDLAHGAYRWFDLLWKAQPDLPNRLYSATDGSELIMEGHDERSTWQVITDFTKPRQAFYNPGIAAAFLGRYAMATGSTDALDLARSYLDLTVEGTDAQFDYKDSVQVCKFSWGASILFEATGEQRYRDYAARMGQWFVDAQNPDGSWDNSPFLMAEAKHPESVRVEITAEFVQHLVTISTALGSEPRKALS